MLEQSGSGANQPTPRSRRAKAEADRSASNPSNFEIEVKSPEVFWQMALGGHLKHHETTPKFGRPISEDNGIVLALDEKALTVSLKLSLGLRDDFGPVDFGDNELRMRLERVLKCSVAIDPESHSISLSDVRKRGLAPIAKWPPPKGQIYDREFDYSVPRDLIKNASDFKREAERALKILQTILLFGFEKLGKQIPALSFAIDAPQDMKDQYRQEKPKERSRRITASMKSELVPIPICHETARLRSSEASFPEIRGTPEAMDKIRSATKFMREGSPPPEKKLGLIRRHIIIIEGEDPIARCKLVDGLAGDLGAAVCEVVPNLQAWDKEDFFRNLVCEARPHLSKFLRQRMVIQLQDFGNEDDEGDKSNVHRVCAISGDALLSVLDELQAWQETVVVFSIPDASRLHPQIQDRAICTVSSDPTEAGLAEILKQIVEQIESRGEGVVTFDLDHAAAAGILWRDGCRGYNDLIAAVEQAVVTKSCMPPEDRQKPIRAGHLSLAWELIHKRRSAK